LPEPLLDLESFWARFEAVEARTHALSRRFGTVQLYALQRTRIFYAIAEQLGLFDNPHPHFTKSELPAGVAAITKLDNLAPADAVVIPFRRRVGGTDPYSDVIRKQLAKDGRRVRVIDFVPAAGLDGTFADLAADEIDLERLKAYFAETHAVAVARIMKFTSRRPQVQSWQKLISEFESAFGISLEKFKKYPQWLVRRTLAEKIGFAQLFKKLGAKDLYLVNAYSEPSIVLGAKKAGLKVHEIQHGFISAFHPAYSFAGRGRQARIDSAPHEILTWGSYWGSGVSLAKGTKLRVTGPTAPFNEYRAKALSENRIVPKQVLFTSQGAIALELFNAALATAAALPDHNIIYRLHPNEALEDFEALLEAARHLAKAKGQTLRANFILSHRDPIFLDLVSRSEFLIGAFSTTLFEGLALGCKVLVLPLNGYENTKPAILAGDITLITSLEELPAALKVARRAQHPEKYYAKEDHA
jgi:hypothetical protein